VLNSRGAERLRTGDAPGAAADFTRVLEGNPNHVPTRVARATARLHLLDLDGALADCADALRVEPRNREALINRASARMMQQQFAEAMADVTVLFDAEPTSPEVLYLRGIARVGLEQYAGALADLDEVVRTAPQLAAGWAARGNAKYHLGDATAAADYREAFKIDPTSSTRVLLRLVRDQERHKLPQVLAECQAFRARDRSDGISLARRGLTRLFQGRAADANLDFAAFRKLLPGDAGILDALIAAANKAVAEKKR
jgi:tetratricopeptide (TPR) repeat protein